MGATHRPRRHKVLYVSDYRVLDLLRPLREVHRMVLVDEPWDVAVVSVHYSPARAAFGFLLYHDDYPEVADGVECPEIVPRTEAVRFAPDLYTICAPLNSATHDRRLRTPMNWGWLEVVEEIDGLADHHAPCGNSTAP